MAGLSLVRSWTEERSSLRLLSYMQRSRAVLLWTAKRSPLRQPALHLPSWCRVINPAAPSKTQPLERASAEGNHVAYEESSIEVIRFTTRCSTPELAWPIRGYGLS